MHQPPRFLETAAKLHLRLAFTQMAHDTTVITILGLEMHTNFKKY